MGERERGRGGNKRKGKQFVALFVGTWVDQFGLDCGKAEAKKRQRSRGAATDMIIH